MGGVSVGGGSVEGECGRRVWKESVERECWRFNCVDCVERSWKSRMCGLCVWLAVWEEGMGGMCGISSTQTQEDRMVNRKRTHNQGIRIEDVALNNSYSRVFVQVQNNSNSSISIPMPCTQLNWGGFLLCAHTESNIMLSCQPANVWLPW